MKRVLLFGLAVGLLSPLMVASTSAAQREYLAGYLIIPIEKVDKSYNAGFSMYVAAWQLQRNYPGHNFQSGLPGTWMFAQHDTPPPFKFYSDIEGGLGWWRDTRFPTETPKFIMGGVGPDFSEIANGPAHGWGSWEKPRGLYGVAQLSPWLLFPIDGLNIKQGASGELFGYGYLNLPLCDARTLVDGKEIPTGGNCWTLFISAANFKGPVAFFTPHFWANSGMKKDPRLVGYLLDSRPAEPNRAVQMETQWIPCRIAKDSKGESYARIAPTLFPLNENGMSILVHKDTVYNNKALYDAVKAWLEGGPVSNGAINPEGAFQRQFVRRGYATWQIHIPNQDGKGETRIDIDWNSFATPTPLDQDTYAYQWNFELAKKEGKYVVLPEYYKLVDPGEGKKPKWKPVPPDKVPTETGLHQLKFERPVEKKQPPYTTPEEPQSCWKKPGPKAGPFKVRLGDGSIVTYYWYRFADQPAMLNAGLTEADRERMQAKVEKLHREWTKDRVYLPLPSRGKLAEVDPAQLVTPPKGLEFGYVPIATKQEPGQ